MNALNDYFNDSDDDDDDFEELVVHLAFPVNTRIIRKRSDHFHRWSAQEFFDRFRLSKEVVKFVLDLIEEQIRSPTNR